MIQKIGILGILTGFVALAGVFNPLQLGVFGQIASIILGLALAVIPANKNH